jgi:hypothetical protein
MSILDYCLRPLVAFDVENAEHRKHVYDFLVNRGWAKCPFRFILPDNPNLNLEAAIKQTLLDYYMGAEFSKPKPATRKRNN